MRHLQGQLGATFRYQSHRFTSFPGSLTDPNIRLPGRTTFDLRAGLSYRNYQLQIRAENITDRRGIANYMSGNPASTYLMRPRSFTVSVSTSF